MRPDQIEALQLRSEELVDLFMQESDPERWPGQGLEPGEMDQRTRGDRYWCKKDAVATLACAQRIESLVEAERRKTVAGVTPGDEARADDLDKEIREAEKEAAKIIDGAASKARKSEFDRRVHGKP